MLKQIANDEIFDKKKLEQVNQKLSRYFKWGITIILSLTMPLYMEINSVQASETTRISCPKGIIKGLFFERYRRDNGRLDTYNFRLNCTEGVSENSKETLSVYGSLVDSGEVSCPEKLHSLHYKQYRQLNLFWDTYQFRGNCGDGYFTSPSGTTLGSANGSEQITEFCENGAVALDIQYNRYAFQDSDNYSFALICKN